MRDAVELRRRVALVRQQADNCYKTVVSAYDLHDKTHSTKAGGWQIQAAAVALAEHLQVLRTELGFLHDWTGAALELLDEVRKAKSLQYNPFKEA